VSEESLEVVRGIYRAFAEHRFPSEHLDQRSMRSTEIHFATEVERRLTVQIRVGSLHALRVWLGLLPRRDRRGLLSASLTRSRG